MTHDISSLITDIDNLLEQSDPNSESKLGSDESLRPVLLKIRNYLVNLQHQTVEQITQTLIAQTQDQLTDYLNFCKPN